MTLVKYSPSDGAGGAQLILFFDLIIWSNFWMLHLPSPTYFRQPIIDLTWFWRNDWAFISISIMCFLVKKFIDWMVLTGVLEEQFEDLNVEKSFVPINFFAPFFIIAKLSFFITCQHLLSFNVDPDLRFKITYLYILAFAEYRAWKASSLLLKSKILMPYPNKKS